MQRQWLEKLKLVELHRVAASLGSPSSGTKSTRIDNIQRTIQQASKRIQDGPKRDLSIVSIDMGIRNLAFCHLKSATPAITQHQQPSRIQLHAWQRMSFGNASPVRSSRASLPDQTQKPTQRESFEPTDYAKHAYEFVKTVVDKYQPTHVLIERQRFRSGGQAAVQEWSIRVGVFEGMLYAILRTLIEQEYCHCDVLPMLPVQVNQYWTMQSGQPHVTSKGTKITAKAMKQYKIDLVGRMLENRAIGTSGLDVSSQASETKIAFLARLHKSSSASSDLTLKKLDDLSDCLLQGLAWLAWQENSFRADQVGQEALRPLLNANSQVEK